VGFVSEQFLTQPQPGFFGDLPIQARDRQEDYEHPQQFPDIRGVGQLPFWRCWLCWPLSA